MAINKWLIFFIISLYALTGCQAANNSSIPTYVNTISTSTLEPTSTPLPTNTAQPTNTPRPTSTPVTPTATTPSSDVLAKYLENVRVVGYDNFNNPSGWSDTNEISNGVLKLTGFGGSDWHGSANNAFFQEDKGAVISFKFTPGAFFEMFFENGQWNTDQYIRFGVYVNHGSAQAQFFNQSKGVDPYELPGNLFLNAETWYSMFMVTGKNGDLLTVIWDPVRPNTHLRYRETVESLKGINWIFRTQVYEGTIIYDDFEEITFDEIK